MKKIYLIAIILIIVLSGCVSYEQAQKSKDLARFSALPFLPGMERDCKPQKVKKIKRYECSPWK